MNVRIKVRSALVSFQRSSGVIAAAALTFFVSPSGRNGDRGGDLHGKGDPQRPQHLRRQEQGEPPPFLKSN